MLHSGDALRRSSFTVFAAQMYTKPDTYLLIRHQRDRKCATIGDGSRVVALFWRGTGYR